MKYCTKCGCELLDEAAICPSCGCPQSGMRIDSRSFGYACLGFCFPLIGLIMFLVWRDSTPLRAKSIGKGALVAVLLPVIFFVIFFVISLITSMTALSTRPMGM